MLMKPDKKKEASLIIAGIKGPEKSPMSDDGAEQDNSMAEETAAEDLISAIEQKSPKAIVEAFKNMLECCKPVEEAEESSMSEMQE